MSDPHLREKALALKVAVSASISLAIMMVDFVCLMHDEVKYVWPRIRTSWTSWIYIFSRYLGIASQIYNVYFTVRMYLGVYTSPQGCRLWFTYQAVVVQILLLFVEGLLMHRIYALFLRNRFILVILISFAVGQMASMWVSARLSFPSNKHTVTCMMVRANPGNAFFSATTLTTNMVIFFMTFWRYLRLPVKWTRHGLGRVVLRDSAWSLSAITVIMLFLMLCSLNVIKSSMGGNITYYWLVCVLWVSIGRIIVNHAKVPRDEGEQGEGSTWRGTVQLTSQIEMGQSTLSVDTQCASADGQTPTSRTLGSSPSTPMTKESQLSPSSAASDSSPRCLGDCSPSNGHGRRHSPQSSSTELPVEVSIRRLSRSNVSTSDHDVPRSEDPPHPDADADECARSHSPSPQPSSSELPPSKMSS